MPVSKVKIYTTTICPWCIKAKEFLKENKIPYEEVNVSGNMKAVEEMVKKSGQMGVPVLDVNGKIIVGFDKNAIKKALNLNIA